MKSLSKSLYLVHLFIIVIVIACFLFYDLNFYDMDVLIYIIGYLIVMGGMRIIYMYHLFFINKSLSNEVKKSYFFQMHLSFIPFSIGYWYRYILPNR